MGRTLPRGRRRHRRGAARGGADRAGGRLDRDAGGAWRGRRLRQPLPARCRRHIPIRCWSPRPTASAPSSRWPSGWAGTTRSGSTSSTTASTTSPCRAPTRSSSSTTWPPAGCAPTWRRRSWAASPTPAPRAGVALVGGETAELPDLYQGDDFDLAGFIVGVVARRDVIDGSGVRAGDALIGLPSSGLHTNGYSLARRVLRQDEWRQAGVGDRADALARSCSSRIGPTWTRSASCAGRCARRGRRAGLCAHHRRRLDRQHPAHAAGWPGRRGRDRHPGGCRASSA